MENNISLTSLNSGQTAVITQIGAAISGQQRRRLLDLGIIPGAKIKHQIDSPLGDTRAFEILESIIALRKEQTDHIYIKR